MDRIDVYKALDSERAYQDFMTASDDRPDMVEIALGSAILAAEHCLQNARRAWYYGSGDHEQAMVYLRKVAALAVQMGEHYGMPRREGF